MPIGCLLMFLKRSVHRLKTPIYSRDGDLTVPIQGMRDAAFQKARFGSGLENDVAGHTTLIWLALKCWLLQAPTSCTSSVSIQAKSGIKQEEATPQAHGIWARLKN